MNRNDRKIPCPLQSAARKFAHKPAIITSGGIYTFEQYNLLVSNVAANLKRLDLQPADRLAFVVSNRFESPFIIMAALRLGATVYLLSPHLPDNSLMDYIKEFKCKITVVSDECDRIEQLSPVKAAKLFLPGPSNMPTDNTIDLDRDATIILTSGSSARPKPVLHTYGNHHYSALGANKNIPFSFGDRWLLSLPLYHAGGLSILFRSILNGGAVVIPTADKSLSEEIIYNQITHLSLVTTQLYRLLEEKKHSKETVKTLKAVLLGGSSFPRVLLEQALSERLPLYKSYGLSETASQVTTTSFEDIPKKITTSGKILDYREIKISEEKEILVKGEILFKGYIEADGINPARDTAGWFHTGDIGYLDRDSYLVVTGRRDNMFTSGGENIQPEEIEQHLCALAFISEAIVVPVPNREFGFRPVAFVKTKEDTMLNAMEIKNHLEKNLPRFKIPDIFFGWPKEVPGELKPNRRFFIEEARHRSG